MCVVIDVNRIPSVFSSSASDHSEFQPLADWIDQRKIMMVYGGTSYRRELSQMRRYLPMLEARKRAGQIHEANDGLVDAMEHALRQRTAGTAFNDQAIVAIVIVARCRWICSGDGQAFPFFKGKALYPSRFKRPSIYSGRNNMKRLKAAHSKDTCGPCSTRARGASTAP